MSGIQFIMRQRLIKKFKKIGAKSYETAATFAGVRPGQFLRIPGGGGTRDVRRRLDCSGRCALAMARLPHITAAGRAASTLLGVHISVDTSRYGSFLLWSVQPAPANTRVGQLSVDGLAGSRPVLGAMGTGETDPRCTYFYNFVDKSINVE